MERHSEGKQNKTNRKRWVVKENKNTEEWGERKQPREGLWQWEILLSSGRRNEDLVLDLRTPDANVWTRWDVRKNLAVERRLREGSFTSTIVSLRSCNRCRKIYAQQFFFLSTGSANNLKIHDASRYISFVLNRPSKMWARFLYVKCSI